MRPQAAGMSCHSLAEKITPVRADYLSPDRQSDQYCRTDKDSLHERRAADLQEILVSMESLPLGNRFPYPDSDVRYCPRNLFGLTGRRRKVGEITFAAGFGDILHFNRLFKRGNGATPREFRRAVMSMRI
jgi:AraC-like DNA-binding protein